MKKSVKYVEWSDKNTVGIKSIDNQHKHFIDIMNDLFEVMQTDEDGAVAKIIDELANHADNHFANEEAYFDEFDYPGAKEHKAEHAKIRVQIIKFLDKKEQDPFKSGYALLDLLEDWLFNHIDKMDRKYIEFFKSKGIK